jgi:cyclopropane fatty-acyl-phospholipid synthase-like methyltransferase
MTFGHSEFKVLGEINSVPQNVSFLAPGANKMVDSVSISICWDELNQFTKITNYQTEEYYEDYFMTTTWSSSMQKIQEDQVRTLHRIAADRNLKIDSLVEVGCGDGSFLQHAGKTIPNVVGIEPSKPFADYARSCGFTILDGYVVAGNPLTKDKFDAFASRQVFEHLPNPLDCLIGIKEMLNSQAIGLIEVPNGYRALQLGRFYEFFPDHINYYSVNSLVSLASAAGFNVISCNESFNGDYLELWVQLPGNPSTHFNNLINLRKSLITSIESWIQSAASSRLIFGCGAKTLSIIATNPNLFSENFAFAVDSDPNKIGKYIPNTSIEIVALTDSRLSICDSALIMALSYTEEIAGLIKAKLPNCKSLTTLSNDGKVIQI